jgi:[NiFe] hydrogenase diaphorase moiety large subunit
MSTQIARLTTEQGVKVSLHAAPEQLTARLLADSGNDPSQLVQHLHTLQLQCSYVPEVSIQLLAEHLDLTEAHVRGVIGFYAFLHETPRGDYDVCFSDSITDHMLGSRALMQDLCTRLGVDPGVPRSDGRVTVTPTSCTGMCDQGPAVLVNGRAITRLDSHRIESIAALIENRTPLEEWPAAYFEIEDNIQRKDMLLSNALAPGSAIQALVDRGPEGILDAIDAAHLLGRGGAGYNTARKWKFCRDADGGADDADRVVVCNADEGEPGTFKDRVLLNSYANDVFEGMTLCAGTIGARRGFLYLRGEYLYLRDRLEQILDERRRVGLLGAGIGGREGFDFDIEIHMGAGAYICGEESALIESLEGKRGVPRVRPPYPVTHGYLGRPTVVNNVETLVKAARVAVSGADWFKSAGTERSTGTKLLSVSGDCERPGIYEFPFGVTIQRVLDDCGAMDAQAVQVSGAAGTTLPPSEFGRRIAFEDVATAGSFMVFDSQRDLLDMVRNFAHFFVHESCGFCTPCRVGGALVKDLVDKVHAGHGSRFDIDELRNIGGLMKASSQCGLGVTAPNAVLDTLNKFPKVYDRRLSQKNYEPAFDLDAALQEAREITGRDDAGAHFR